MNLLEVKNIAKEMGINIGKMKKVILFGQFKHEKRLFRVLEQKCIAVNRNNVCGVKTAFENNNKRNIILEGLKMQKMPGIRKAVIPAAGLGTRFLPATKAQPKEMLPIVDKPCIQYIVEEAVDSGIEDILIITGRNKRAIEDHFDRAIELEMTLKAQGKYELLGLVEELSKVTIHYVRQKEPKGLGHAVSCAKKFVGDEPFAVLLGDDVVDADVPLLRQLMNVYEEYGGTILGVQEVPRDKVSSYGIVKASPVQEHLWLAEDLIEKPTMEEAPSNLAVLGRYIISPHIFDILDETSPGRSGEIQLTDALKKLSEIESVYAFQFDGRRYDVGDKQGYLEANVEYALKRPDLREPFLRYLINTIVQELKTGQGNFDRRGRRVASGTYGLCSQPFASHRREGGRKC